MNKTNYRLFDDPENPTLDEITGFVHDMVLHSCRVEYYLRKLAVHVPDGQHPHDLVGKGNKLEWEVLRRLARQDGKHRAMEGVEIHRRGQMHHHKWNSHNPNATEPDLRYGAIDAICSLREDRAYQGGAHSWDDIAKIIGQNDDCKKQWLLWAMREIKKLEEKGEGFPPDRE